MDAITTPVASWHAPVPGAGKKTRDSVFVAEKLAAWCPRLIALPFAGLAGELSRYHGAAKLIVADSDPAVRVLWKIANEGRLAEAGEAARGRWRVMLKRWTDDEAVDLLATRPTKNVKTPERARVRAAWEYVRELEPRFAQEGADPSEFELAVWALTVGAGARNGLRRRNGSGGFNAPYDSSYDPTWLTGRLKSTETLAAADVWSRRRVVAIYDDWSKAYDAVERAVARKGPEFWQHVAILNDYPYGFERAAVYDGKWTYAARSSVSTRLRDFVRRGARSVAWIGEQDIETWCPLAPGVELFADGAWHGLIPARVRLAPAGEDVRAPRRDGLFEWRFRSAKTHMKSARTMKNGQHEPARKASGGWMGVSRP